MGFHVAQGKVCFYLPRTTYRNTTSWLSQHDPLSVRLSQLTCVITWLASFQRDMDPQSLSLLFSLHSSAQWEDTLGRQADHLSATFAYISVYPPLSQLSCMLYPTIWEAVTSLVGDEVELLFVPHAVDVPKLPSFLSLSTHSSI